ncbi:hypothetical protein ABIA39_002731 [Nocardia sp. GAS34]
MLFLDPPIANFCMTYPRQPVLLDEVWLPAHQPVIISIAACNNDPAISGGDHTGNRSHLAWGAGPHACPARRSGYLIAQDGVDRLGHSSVLTDAVDLLGRRHILFGSNTLSWWGIQIPDDTILYNLEAVTPESDWHSEELLELFRRYHVWDYNRHNGRP